MRRLYVLFFSLVAAGVLSTVGFASSSDVENEAIRPLQITLMGIDKNNKLQIFNDAVRDDASPLTLQLVCREWRDICKRDIGFKDKQGKRSAGVLFRSYYRLNSMNCLDAFNRFLNAHILYSLENGDILTFSLRQNPSGPLRKSVDIDMFGDAGKALTLTTSPQRFFSWSSSNLNKVNILFCPTTVLKRYLEDHDKDAFEQIPDNCPPLFKAYRYGNIISFGKNLIMPAKKDVQAFTKQAEDSKAIAFPVNEVHRIVIMAMEEMKKLSWDFDK